MRLPCTGASTSGVMVTKSLCYQSLEHCKYIEVLVSGSPSLRSPYIIDRLEANTPNSAYVESSPPGVYLDNCVALDTTPVSRNRAQDYELDSKGCRRHGREVAASIVLPLPLSSFLLEFTVFLLLSIRLPYPISPKVLLMILNFHSKYISWSSMLIVIPHSAVDHAHQFSPLFGVRVSCTLSAV